MASKESSRRATQVIRGPHFIFSGAYANAYEQNASLASRGNGVLCVHISIRIQLKNGLSL